MTGGFTLSGGEPLMQHRFAVKLFAAAQGDGHPHGARHQRLTTATGSRDAELEAIDLVLLDIKTWDPERHRRLTGHGHRRRRSTFARRLAARKRPVWVRFVLVPGLTDDAERHRADRAASRPASATSSASTCCRSTRWAGSSGQQLGLDLHARRTSSRRRRRRSSRRARYSGRRELRAV